MVDEESLYNLEILSADGNSDCEYDHEINLGTELKGEKEDLQVLKWITETKRHNKKMPSSQKIHVRVEEVSQFESFMFSCITFIKWMG